MARSRLISFCALLAMLGHAPAMAQDTPHLQRNGQATQLIVDGQPFLALGGELFNSSASSPRYMAPIWDRLARAGVGTLIGTASWQLVEPSEGQFDFAAVDDQIAQAHAHGMRLVLIWFGAFKNAESRYAPSWVRRDEARFPRSQRDAAFKPAGVAASMDGPALSVFGDRLVGADARAFAALMRHIRQIDHDHTVIMMQVENETGLLGSPRDHGALAQAAWRQPVPEALMRYLRDHRATLAPDVARLWGRQGFRATGTWDQVFGSDGEADELFMAWGFARYVDRVAQAGAAEYALPMYTNAWLGPQPGSLRPGDYPSGGPVAHVLDIWKAGAPTLAFQSPDIYVPDFAGTLAAYRRADNPVFIPEARMDVGNLFIALGQYQALGFSPYGVDGEAESADLFSAYRLLRGMTAQITAAQAQDRIRGFRIEGDQPAKTTLGGYSITASRTQGVAGAFGPGTGTQGARANGYGLIIASGKDEFLVVGRGVSLDFAMPGQHVEIDWAQEGTFEQGQWVPGRLLNGDDTYSLFPDDQLRIVRIKLLRR